MKPRTRAERQREAQAQAAVAGPEAGEAIQRDWAVQLQQKEQHKVVEKLQEKQASLRQLEAAAAQGDADLQRQVILQRAELELDQLKHNVQLPSQNIRSAAHDHGRHGNSGLPPPVAFEGGSGSPKTRAKAGLFDQAPAADACGGCSLFGAPPTHVVKGGGERLAGRAENVSAGDAAAGAPNHPQVLPDPDPTLLPSAEVMQPSPVVPTQVPLQISPVPTQNPPDAGAGFPSRREDSYQLRRDEFLRRRQQQSTPYQEANPMLPPAILPTVQQVLTAAVPSQCRAEVLPAPPHAPISQCLNGQHLPPQSSCQAPLPMWQPLAAAPYVLPVQAVCPSPAASPVAYCQHVPFGPPHQAVAPSPAPAVPSGYNIPLATAAVPTDAGVKHSHIKDDASSAHSAKKAYGEELRRQAELDRERKRDGRLADKIGSPPRQARSLPSDAPVEPNWHIACNGQQMQSGQVPSQPLAPAPLPCRLPTTPTPDPFQREVHEGFLQPPPHGRAVQSGVARARTPRTPMPQSAPEEEYGGFPRGMGQADEAAREKRRNQQEEYRRFLQQQQRDKSPGTENRRRQSQIQEVEPDRGGAGFVIGAPSADVAGRRQRQEEMRRVLAEQVAEKEKQKEIAKQLREKEEMDEMERLRREADEEKRKYEAEKEREAQKKRALLQEGQEAAARKVAEKEAQAASAKAEVAESIPLPGKAASTSVQSESSGTPTGSRHSHHAKHVHGRRRGKAATPDQSHSEQEPGGEAGRPDLFGPPQPFGGCPPAPFMPSPPKPVVQPEPSHELLKGVVHQQQELYRQQQESLSRLQEEADKLKREKEAAQQNLLDLKEKQVEEKEVEVKKLQKKLQRQLVLNGGGDVPGGNLSEKIDVLLSPGGTDAHASRRQSADGGIGIAGAGGLPFRSKYEESASSRQMEAGCIDEQSSLQQGLQQSQVLENGRSPQRDLPVWESSPGPLAKSGGWSEAPLPWLQDDGEELEPVVDLAGGRFADSTPELGSQVGHSRALLDLPVRKGNAGLEDSLFDDSWGSPLTGRGNPDTLEASLPHVDATSTVGQTLIGESKLVAPGFQDKTWQEVRLSPRAEPSPLQDTDLHGEHWLTNELDQSWRSLPVAPARRAGLLPVAQLEAAVRAIHEVNGTQGILEGSLHMQHGFEKDIAEVELDVTALRSERATTSFSTLGLDHRSVASLRSGPAAQLHDSMASAAGPTSMQVAAAVGSWEGMLQKFGGQPSARGERSEGQPVGFMPERPPSADALASPAASQDSLGMPGIPPRGRSGGKAADSQAQPSSLLNSEDFALLAAADQEDFDAFLARLQKTASTPEGSAPSAKAPSSLPRPKVSAGAPLAALSGYGRERVRTGSPLLRSAGSSVLRTPSSDSRPGSGGGPDQAHLVRCSPCMAKLRLQ
mmetsp:Transcript_30516/g.67179  ORF Transcript_30516/g.67179 Transcript_30516/m.67179 type:complete len:1401 (+) Transcript_30516:47-4249(+)